MEHSRLRRRVVHMLTALTTPQILRKDAFGYTDSLVHSDIFHHLSQPKFLRS